MTTQLHDLFQKGFPHTYCVFSKIVSSSKHYIAIANQFAEVEGLEDKVELDAYLDSDEDYESNAATSMEGPIYIHERAIFEYFLSIIRLKSQKKLRF